jgi:Family of unknown function (DUF5715)
MSGFNSPRVFCSPIAGLFAFLIVLVSGLPAQTISHHHHRRVAKTRPRIAPAETVRPVTAHPRRPLEKRSVSRRSRRAPALEPRHQVVQAEIAKAPLENFRWLPPLRGSRESLLRQNERADQDGLSRIADDEALASMSRNKELVPLPASFDLTVDTRLEATRRYCRPWTAHFLSDLANAYYARFHSPIQVNSAVRTVAYQKHLLLINGNAAPAEGDTRSPHLTGAAIDIAKKELTPTEIGWLRAYLMPLETAGKLDVEEEFEQACFHISVYKTYSPRSVVPPNLPVPARSRRRHTTSLLAARLP